MRSVYHLLTVAISAGVRQPFETSSNVICTEVWFCGTGRRQFSSVELESRENGQSQNGSVLRHLSRELYLRCSGSRSRNAEPGTIAPTCGEKGVGCCLGLQAKIDIPPTCSAALRSVSRAVDRSLRLSALPNAAIHALCTDALTITSEGVQSAQTILRSVRISLTRPSFTP